jgi:hypothetical protein
MRDDKSHENDEGKLSQCFLSTGISSMKRMAMVIGQSYVCGGGHICAPVSPGVDTSDMAYQTPANRP